MYNPTLDSDVYHHDDIRVIGQPLNAVNMIEIDYEAAAARNIATIRRNVANSKQWEIDNAS